MNLSGAVAAVIIAICIAVVIVCGVVVAREIWNHVTGKLK